MNPPYPDWRALLAGDPDGYARALASSRGGPAVLLATGVGGHLAVAALDGLLAAALTMRGAQVHVLLCDGTLPACELLTLDTIADPEAFFRTGAPRDKCRACLAGALDMFNALGVQVHTYGGLVTDQERAWCAETARDIAASGIPDFTLDGCKAGEHALAGALRFYAKGSLEDEPAADAVLRHYFSASLLSVHAVWRLLQKHDFVSASFHHGIYVPQGLVGEAARAMGVRVVNWQVAYRKRSFIFSHHETYHHALQTEPTANWEGIPWDEGLEARTLDYLRSRWDGARDWIWFHEGRQRDADAIRAQLGLDPGRPVLGLLTNVVWDAQLHYPANAFRSMADWVVATIRYVAQRPDLQLAIRVHPAELRGGVPSRERMAEVLARRLGELPGNVRLVPPESEVSTYALLSLCDCALIYGTKTGVELTSMGIPVVVAGEAWIRGKGLTLDADSAAAYNGILARLPLGRRLEGQDLRRARMYAYHFFFRRMIPLANIEPQAGWPPFTVRLGHPGELLPGRDPGLDVIVQGILNGTDFIYPDERHHGHAA